MICIRKPQAEVSYGLHSVLPGLPEEGVRDEVLFDVQIQLGAGGGSSSTFPGVHVRDVDELLRALRRARNNMMRSTPVLIRRRQKGGR